MHDILKPSPDALMGLLHEVIDLLAPLTFVRKILCFGSLARGNWDCWSDLDLLVVVDSRSQYTGVLQHLQKARPIVHRNHLVANVEPSGGHVLGIIFGDTSVFHCLDLNLLSQAEYGASNALQRFGVTQDLYDAGLTASLITEDLTDVASELEITEEVPIIRAVHWTKKAAKNVLRGQDDLPDLIQHANRLKLVMATKPANLVIDGRQVGWLAHTYLHIADLLAQAQRSE